MIEKVYIDAAALEAFLVAESPYHTWTGRILKEINPPLLSCQAVMDDVCRRIHYHPAGLRALRRMLESGLIRLQGSLDGFYPQVFRLMHQFRQAPMSFSEACLIVLADQDNGCHILSTRSAFKSTFHFSDRRSLPLLSPDLEQEV